MAQRTIDEQENLIEILTILKENQERLSNRVIESEERIAGFYHTDGLTERNLHNLLIINQNQLDRCSEDLSKHSAALESPYFARVDFDDLTDGSYESLHRMPWYRQKTGHYHCRLACPCFRNLLVRMKWGMGFIMSRNVLL